MITNTPVDEPTGPRSNVTVAELIPGDEIAIQGLAGETAVFITRTVHPLWSWLQLVVWRLRDGTWSHDALDIRQVVGHAAAATPPERRRRLSEALIGSSPDPR